MKITSGSGTAGGARQRQALAVLTRELLSKRHHAARAPSPKIHIFSSRKTPEKQRGEKNRPSPGLSTSSPDNPSLTLRPPVCIQLPSSVSPPPPTRPPPVRERPTIYMSAIYSTLTHNYARQRALMSGLPARLRIDSFGARV